ncbi:MAG: hypothetical protein K9N11_08440 [Lentisphaeria bacterium]|nr:hypothetical protein [Candidatus Neomarinimicrobiota bacterium]MCF7842864.1 hypothetical protein [Lentisphaeria bacterium]
MIDETLLEILRCPETMQPLRMADSALIEKVNTKVKTGTLKNIGGEVIEEPLTSGLVREDEKILYPIRDDIPVMLIDEGISLT